MGSKALFRQASGYCKRVIESAENRYTKKTKKYIVSQRVGFHDFWQIANSVLNSGKSAIPLLFNGPVILTCSSEKAKLFTELFSKNFILKNFKATSNLNLSKASGPDDIPVVVLKNCEPELSFILINVFNLCLKKSCFPHCWKASTVIPVFKNVGERCGPKYYRPVT